MSSIRCLPALLIAFACLTSTAARADDTAGLLQGVRWAGPPVSLDAFSGKTVVVMNYVTWCPKCNKWTPEFCKQLKAAIEGKPVVVLAINTDETPSSIKKYVSEHDMTAPNIILGFDPAYAKRAGQGNLWDCMIIDPAGKVVKKEQCGMHFGDDTHMEFTLPKEISESKKLGSFIVMDPKMDEAVKETLWPLELGQATGGLSAAARKKLSAEQLDQIDAAMGKYLDTRLAEIQKQAKGDLSDRFDAYDLAASLSTHFKTSDQGKDARKLMADLETDAKFKRELAAKRAFEKCQQSTLAAKPKSSMMKTLAKRFEGTQYGEKAKTAGEAKAAGEAKGG